ncbi:MAG: hypothetical protein HY231_15770 [Acidobacteria bacterium]|nr:hypothetical protein [Acidobacteriota bacterium]
MSDDFTPSQELVRSKVQQLFPAPQWATVFRIIGFADQSPDAIGQARVQLALLKLSAGDVDQLSYFATVAKLDFRDVLAWAEYPNAFHQLDFLDLDETTRQQVAQKDRQQYIAWLQAADPPEKS